MVCSFDVRLLRQSHPWVAACWAGTAGAYITVDLSSPTRIGGIITQGCDGYALRCPQHTHIRSSFGVALYCSVNYYTKEFQVEWSLDGTEYLPLHVHENGTVATFDANSDTYDASHRRIPSVLSCACSSSLVTTTFEHGVYARFLRVMPTVYESYPSLRYAAARVRSSCLPIDAICFRADWKCSAAASLNTLPGLAGRPICRP